ncbi:hypothetical protein [Achromobacter mucicolens]|uniref:hypothetical protein n=1 Tax=Achromobacter mucicolens TaxID=1389922 RepID=UPI002FE00167
MIRSVVGVVALGVTMSANAAGKWYEGGTLHNATLREWSGAVTQNKMATMADMVIAAKLAKRPMDVVDRAVRTASCVDEVARDEASQTQDVAAVAAMCMMNGS